MLKITEVFIYWPDKKPGDGAKAMAGIMIENQLNIHGIRIFEDKGGPVAFMPSTIGKGWWDRGFYAVVPANLEFGNYIQREIINAYERSKNERKQKDQRTDPRSV